MPDDDISKFLGMKSIDEVLANKQEIIEYKEQLPADSVKSDPRKDEDFESARDMVKDVLNIGTTALEEMAAIAQQSQSPAAYEKLGALMNSMTAASKVLLEIHKKKKEIDKADIDTPGLADGDAEKTVVHNNLFVGSTRDLQNMIEGMRKANAEKDADDE